MGGMIKVGIIGAGEISGYHIQILKEIKTIEVVAICDNNLSRVNLVGNLHGIKRRYEDYCEMITKEKPDVVHVLTPPKFHAQIAIEAMKMGCHVLVEKPMALSYEDAVQMVTTARIAGRHLAVCEIYHFDPVVIRARNMLETGAIGKLIYVETYWFTDILGESNAYSMKGSGSGWAHGLRGGAFANFLDHPVYLQRDFIGEINTLNTNCNKIGNNPFISHDELRVSLSGNDRTGYIVASLNGKPRINFLRLYGTEGIITADMANLTLTTLKNRRLPGFMSKGVNNFSQSFQLARDTIETTLAIMRKKIKARQGLRTFIKSFYSRLNFKDSNIDDSLIFNCEKALETVRILDKIWDSAQLDKGKKYLPNKLYINHGRTDFTQKEQNKNRRKVLVTGAGGFLGIHLVNELLKRDLVVRVIVRKINKRFEEDKNIEVVYGDIRDPECVMTAVNGVDTIYHCASLTTNKGSWQNFVETNIKGTENLLEAATKYGINRFVYVSSVVVYGFNKRKGRGLVCENDEYGTGLPLYSYYAKSKIEAEKIVWEYYQKKTLPIVILRPGIIFGPEGKNIFKNSLVIFGGKRKVLPYIYVKDVVSALILAGDSSVAVGKAYNVVSDEQPTQCDFRKKVNRVIGVRRRGVFLPLPVMYMPARLLEFYSQRKKSNTSPPFGIFHYKSLVRNLRYDNSKIKGELGWAPIFSLEEGIRETFEHVEIL